MTQWTFVIAAYAVVFGGTGGLFAWSLAALRTAERRATELSERR